MAEQNRRVARRSRAQQHDAGGSTTEDYKPCQVLKDVFDDDGERLKRWLVHGKIDGAHLAKMLPLTVQELMEGKITYEAAVGTLNEMTVRRRFHEFAMSGLSRRTIPESWCRNEEQKHWLAQSQQDFKDDLIRRCDFGPTGEFGGGGGQLTADNVTMMLVAHQETCNNWAQRVDQALFHGKKSPTFLFLCPTNKLSHDDFRLMILDIFRVVIVKRIGADEKKEMHSRLFLLQNAFFTVAAGAHDALTSCWECDRGLVNVSFDCCSSCNVARYCSRECQVRAWKSGHKKWCARLKRSYHQFLDSQKEVERFHETRGSTLEGLTLSLLYDHCIASGICRSPCGCPVVTTDDGLLLGVPRGPSMKYFYENFGRVLRREWWVYPAAKSREEYIESIKEKSQDEQGFFIFHLCFFLAHDLFGFASEISKDRGMDESAVMSLLLKTTPVASKQDFEMPAVRFIEIYNANATRNEENNPAYPNRHRSNMKAHALKDFRAAFHK